MKRLCDVKNPTECPTLCIPLSDDKKNALLAVMDDSKDGYCVPMLKYEAFQKDTPRTEDTNIKTHNDTNVQAHKFSSMQMVKKQKW